MKSMYVMSWWFSPYTFIIFYPPKTRNKQLQPVKASRFPSPSKSANEAQAAASFLLLGSKKLRNTTWNLSMKLEVFQATWKNQTWQKQSCKKCNLKSNHEKWHLKKVTPEKNEKNQKKRKPENCKEYGQMKPEKYLKRITPAKITWKKQTEKNWNIKRKKWTGKKPTGQNWNKWNRRKTSSKNSNRKKSRTTYPERTPPEKS